MHQVRTRYFGSETASLELVLPFDKRQKSRLRARASDGSEVAVELERGSALRDGDLLQRDDGVVIRVVGEPESVSVVSAASPLALCRAAYHLGNRHVPLEVNERELAYLHDHVLDDMVRGLGLEVRVLERPFEPEAGAYGSGHAHAGGRHSHGLSRARIHHHHAHGSSHSHSHSHSSGDE